MENVEKTNKVIIVVEGGFVSDVFKTSSQDIEIEILDKDCAERESPEALERLEELVRNMKTCLSPCSPIVNTFYEKEGMNFIGIDVDPAKLLSKHELLDYLARHGECDKVLADIRARYQEAFGNEMIWRYPISDGKHLGTFIAMVREGFLSLPYDVIDPVEYELIETKDAAMFKSEDFEYFIDDWILFSDDLLNAMRDMHRILTERENQQQ